MALKLLAIGCIKAGRRVCGYRLIDYNDAIRVTTQGQQIKYIDVPSESIIATIKSNQVTVENLEVVGNELRGSNGQYSRYGAIDASTKMTKNQVMVIVGEVKDIKDCLVGYICSDTDGKIVRLLEEQAIAQASRLGLANGKLVDNGKGRKHISAISGGYSVFRLNYDYKARVKSLAEQTKSQKAPNQNGNTTATTNSTEQHSKTSNENKDNAEQIYNKAINTISELEKFKEFKGDFSYKIASAVRRWHKCSEKQLAVLEKALDKFKEQNKDNITPNNNSKEPAKKKENKFTAGIKPIEVEGTTEDNNTNTIQKEKAEDKVEDAINSNENSADENNANGNSANENNANDSTAQSKSTTQKSALKDILDKQKVPSSILNKPVSDLSIFDFGLINNEVYIRGFKDNVEVPDCVVMPDTVMVNGQNKPVVGIAIEAFKKSKMCAIKTGKYIKDIGASAFYECNKLEVIDLSASQHSMIPAKMACSCTNLKVVHLGGMVDRIHELAFYGCTSLTAVDGNESIDTIARQSFALCRKLARFKPMPKFINEGAFEDCHSLTESGFCFDKTVNIAAKGFRGAGFKNLVLPQNLKSVGRKAFADCALLKTVDISEGVELVDMYCFAKSKESCSKSIITYLKMGIAEEDTYCSIEVIDTPKSLKDVGNDAFRHVSLVKVFTGSASESVCIGFNVPYERKDKITQDNATKVRQRSTMLNIDPIKMLFDHLNRELDGASNPEFNVDSSKFLNAKLSNTHFETLGLKTPTTEPIEPHIKFKAALKYAMDLAEPFTLPLTPGVLRFSSIIKIETNELFGDGWNEIYRVTFFKRDTLENGSFIMFMQGDTLVYIVEASSALDIELTIDSLCNSRIPIKDHLHAGDKIGNDSTIDGRDASKYTYEIEGGMKRRANVGLLFFNRIKSNSIIIRATRTTYIYYVPATGFALVLFDSRKDKEESVYKNNNKYVYFTVTKILTYSQMLDLISSDKNLKISNSESYNFFYDLSQIRQSDANNIIASVKYVAEESCDTLFNAGLQCEKMLKSKNMQSSDMKPDMLTYDMFKVLTESYWMVEKDLEWYHSISAKTLNKTNEYTIGSFTVIEYRSNQVVKFNNPYMHGKKNSMIFVMKRGNQIFGIYASIYTLEKIANMLAELTYMPDGYKDRAPKLMTDAKNIDEVDPKYFYHFYEVLQTTGGWDLQKNYGGYATTFLYCVKSNYHLSMYKPTGVFYLTMDTYVLKEVKDVKTGKKKESRLDKVTYPIFPIGDMDRALMVADTTNTNNRYTRFKDELVQLAIYEKAKRANRTYVPSSEAQEKGINPTNYYIVRQMSIDGVHETFEYAKYVDDRAVFMIGRVHSDNVEPKTIIEQAYFDEDDTYDEYNNDFEDDFEDDSNSDSINDYDFEDWEDDELEDSSTYEDDDWNEYE